MSAKRVLIVDDELDLVELLSEVLANEDYNATPASSAAMALAAIETQDFDVVISDIRMPDIDGIQLMRKIRSKKPSLGFIIISGFSDYQESEILREGAYCFLHKPVRSATLIKTLSEYFQSRV